MKKILFLSTIFISSLTPVNAQFKVDSNDGAKISKPFEVPLGVQLVINRGAIE